MQAVEISGRIIRDTSVGKEWKWRVDRVGSRDLCPLRERLIGGLFICNRARRKALGKRSVQRGCGSLSARNRDPRY